MIICANTSVCWYLATRNWCSNWCLFCMQTCVIVKYCTHTYVRFFIACTCFFRMNMWALCACTCAFRMNMWALCLFRMNMWALCACTCVFRMNMWALCACTCVCGLCRVCSSISCVGIHVYIYIYIYIYTHTHKNEYLKQHTFLPFHAMTVKTTITVTLTVKIWYYVSIIIIQMH